MSHGGAKMSRLASERRLHQKRANRLARLFCKAANLVALFRLARNRERYAPNPRRLPAAAVIPVSRIRLVRHGDHLIMAAMSETTPEINVHTAIKIFVELSIDTPPKTA